MFPRGMSLFYAKVRDFINDLKKRYGVERKKTT